MASAVETLRRHWSVSDAERVVSDAFSVRNVLPRYAQDIQPVLPEINLTETERAGLLLMDLGTMALRKGAMKSTDVGDFTEYVSGILRALSGEVVTAPKTENSATVSRADYLPVTGFLPVETGEQIASTSTSAESNFWPSNSGELIPEYRSFSGKFDEAELPTQIIQRTHFSGDLQQ